jgi:hypothetical protein
MNRNYATIIVTLLGSLKLALEGFGYNIIDNGQINDIANGVSAVLTVAGVVMTHLKKSPAVTSPVEASPIVPSIPAVPVVPAQPESGTAPQTPQ